jgi:hypothetical protein
MNTAVLIALLTAHTWTTDCIMTQKDLHQGFVRESVSFSTEPSLKAHFATIWFHDENCSKPQGIISEKDAYLALGKPISPNKVEADFVMPNKTELGALEYNEFPKSVRMSTNSFGQSRNTMVSIFHYFADSK